MIEREGISPLIASVLLIAFTMAVAGLFSSWAPELLQGIQSDTSEDTENLLDATNAGLSVDSAVFDSDSGNTSVVFRNTGQTELSNFTVTARLEDGSFVQKQVDQSLETAGIVSIELNTSSSPNLVRVDSEELDVSAETESVSGASGDGSTNDGGAPSFSTAPTGSEYESSWVPVEPDTSVQNGFSYFFDETNDEEYYNVSEGFYVMKYEAKPYNNTSNSFDSSTGEAGHNTDYVPRSVAANKPWRDISFNEDGAADPYGAVQACEALDSQTDEFDVHLTTNREWMTVARQVEQTDSNWVGGTVDSSGQLIRGWSDGDYTDDAPLSASIDDSDGKAGILEEDSTNSWSSDSDIPDHQNRTFELANGEVVWDWAGNIRHWIYAEDSGGKTTDGVFDSTVATDGSDDPVAKEYEYDPAVVDRSTNGVGSEYDFTNGDAALRGGDWRTGAGAGVFRAYSYYPDLSHTSHGFRCSAVPVS